MNSYSAFHFSGYSWNHHAGKISLRYSLDKKIDFEETVLLPERISDERLKEKEWEIERALQSLHIIGGISYFKTCLPKSIKVESGFLSKKEAAFWSTVYEKGLGEFFYRNAIDFRGLIKFPEARIGSKDPIKNPVAHVRSLSRNYTKKDLKHQRLLAPIGGGKDSLVTIELLKKAGANVTLLRLGEHPIIDGLASIAGLPLLSIKRTLSPALFRLNKQGALNGHVPITAYLSVLAVLTAILYDFDGVVMSNERSANEGNLEWNGLTINHQWSKSLEFETLFQRHIHEHLGSSVGYWSLLRPLSELRVTQLFSQYPQYLSGATSCNKNWTIEAQAEHAGLWCGACPKCAFVLAMLGAFLPQATVVDLFRKNLFDDPLLLPLFKELLGIERFKPFECVGTPQETAAAFLLARQRKNFSGTAAMTMFEADVLPSIKWPDQIITGCLTPSPQHTLPPELSSLVL